jgi:hypothetical protein
MNSEINALGFAQVVMKHVRSFVEPAFGQLVARSDELAVEIRGLKKRIAELEAARLDFKGVWAADNTYAPGDLVMRSGSTYVAIAGCRGRDPAVRHEQEKCWRMFCKAGRDGRNARNEHGHN